MIEFKYNTDANFTKKMSSSLLFYALLTQGYYQLLKKENNVEGFNGIHCYSFCQ